MPPRWPLKWFDLSLGKRCPMLSAPGNQSSPACVNFSVYFVLGLQHIVKTQPTTSSSIMHHVKLLSELPPCPRSKEQTWDRLLQLSQALCPFPRASVCPGAGGTGGSQPHSLVEWAARHYKGPSQRLLTLWCQDAHSHSLKEKRSPKSFTRQSLLCLV